MRETDHYSAHPEQNIPAPDTTSRPMPTGAQPQSLDRRATVLYLETVRNLEVTKHRFQQQSLSEFNRCTAECRKLELDVERQKPKHEKLPELPSIKIPIILLIAALGVGFLAFDAHSTILFFVAGLIAFLFLCSTPILVSRMQTKRDQVDITARNADADHRTALAEQELEKTIKEKREESLKVQHEFEEKAKSVDKLLANVYAANLIPKQYRNLPAVCYLYDYMSTSQQSLQAALFDFHIEDGIQRIEQKLDDVCNRIIVEIRRVGMGMIAQNTQMLTSLQRTATNTENAAFYARLGSYYAQANTYYSELYH